MTYKTKLIVISLCIVAQVLNVQSVQTSCDESALHLPTKAERVILQLCFPFKFGRAIYEDRKTIIKAFLLSSGNLGITLDEKDQASLGPWLSVCGLIEFSHSCDKRYAGKIVGLYASYKLGLLGVDLIENGRNLQSVAGKVSLQDPAETKNKINIGMATHLNNRTHLYGYVEVAARALPISGMALGIGGRVNVNTSNQTDISPELFIRIPPQQFLRYITFPTIKIGIDENLVPFIRLGLE